jgi:hypothetical protein
MATLRTAFWNAYNLFDVGVVSRWPQTQAELDAKLDALVDVIASWYGGDGPDLLGLVEVGSSAVLSQLISKLNTKVGAIYRHEWAAPVLSTTTGIAFLYRKGCISNVSIAAIEQTGQQRPRCLAIEFEVKSSGHAPTATIKYIICHWKSRMSGGHADRQASGQWIQNAVAASGLRGSVVVVGDFNAEPFESPFNRKHMDASRFFVRPSDTTLYLSSWRYLAEPDLWNHTLDVGYQVSRPKTSHDGSKVIFDQLAVSGSVLKGGPITLDETTLKFDWRDNDSNHTNRTKRVISPVRFSYDSNNTPVSTGYSDHFALLAEFIIT